MADTGGQSGGRCDDRCGCPSPCPGGESCRCTSGGEETHKRCSCGDHCGCNPCTCSKTEVAGIGKAYCRCREGCGCATCAA